MTAEIWVVTGVPGAGKTSVCAELAARLPCAVHIETDRLDEAITRHGAIDDRGLVRAAIARLAAAYAAAGVVAIVDDTLETSLDRRAYTDGGRCRLVHLVPRLEVALARNAARRNKPAGDAPMLDAIATRLYQPMREAHRAEGGWLVVDTSELTVSETVGVLLASRLPPTG